MKTLADLKKIREKAQEEMKLRGGNTRIKEELGNIPLTYPDVIEYIDQSLLEGIQNTNMEDV